jgi:hypothetical protein
MDDALLAAYRATAYRVRLARGGWATIHPEAPLPDALRPLADAHPWGFITAWHPRSRPTPRPANRRAQRSLLADLRALPATVALRAGCGAGDDGWREPSLFVVGPDTAMLDTLARRYEQNAYVYGHDGSLAQLRLLR